MNSNEAIELINRGEGLETEFKAGLSDRKLPETMVAFCNTSGGRIFIGVNKDGAIQGISDSDADAEKVSNIARDMIDPPLSPQTEAVEIGGQLILVVTVPRKAPCSTSGCFFIRSGSTNRRAKTAEVQKMFQDKEALRKERIREELAWDLELRRVYMVLSAERYMGYSNIRDRFRSLDGAVMDKALARLEELGAVKVRRQDVVIGDNLFYLRADTDEWF